MNGGDRPAFDKMPNTQESGLNIKTRLRVDIRKPYLEVSVGNQRKKGMLT